MKKILNNIRKFTVLALFILSIITLFSNLENVYVLVTCKTLALTYFTMFSKANKLID